ncbi:TetR/AcrR family transcriptional regulator [Nocardioides sp.]|uniref:TetR/AcrR family transcriptional regulator n=1 Tax=Nocardioides sp. TaxID=35761 RepID=UPI002733A45F|nr:TetR/AcrR family transcriptional regulator [Nocardioides sp.]MDP3894763.1 TetR/AcrR family transcriptional regulator [Nocardioides sp.]
MSNGKRQAMSAANWIRAGYDAFHDGGVDAIAVERVAKRLSATKGSFYWHFKDRESLVRAVLELWRAETEEIIDQLAAITEPRERLLRLFELVTSQIPTDRSEIDLLARGDQPAVAAVLEDVSRRRITFMSAAFREAGLRPVDADDAAVQAYALWIGLLQLQVNLPGTVPAGKDRDRFLRSTRELLGQLIPAP